MIERAHLAILRQIEKQGSLTAAAVALHLSQSALSHKISKLEHQIGTQLWVKEGRNLKLTPAGSHLLKASKRLLPQLERLDQDLHDFAQGELGTLNIGMECHPCYQWLLGVVEPFSQQWPKLDIDIKQKFQFGGMAALLQHEIDMLVTPDPVHMPSVVFEPVFDYEQVLIVSTDNPLSAKQIVSPRDLSSQVLYTYPVATERLDVYAQFLNPAQVQPRRHKTLESTQMLLQVVAANRGVATLPRWLAQRYAQTLPIKPLKLGADGVKKQIHLGVRSGENSLIHLQRFIQVAKDSGIPTLSYAPAGTY